LTLHLSVSAFDADECPTQARKRHTAKKKNILASHATAATNVETSIATLFDEHENKS
jgi:hypothetical protein